jgi:hypothetical protein
VTLSCVFGLGARQRAFFAVRFFLVHGKGRHTPSHPGAVSCFFCRAPWKNARQRLFVVRCQTWRTAKGLYRAKCYCVPFVVRPDENARQRVCRAFLGLCSAPVAHGKAAVSRSDIFSLLNNQSVLHSVQIIVRLTFFSPNPTTHLFQQIVQNIIFLRWLALLIKILQNDLNLTMYNFFNKIDN